MGVGSDAEARRVYGFLVRRGYSAEVCAEVAREYRGSRRRPEDSVSELDAGPLVPAAGPLEENL